MDIEVLEEIETLNPAGKLLTVQKVRVQVDESTRVDEHERTETRVYYQVDVGGSFSEVLFEEGVFKRKVREGLQEKVEVLRPVDK